MIGNSESHFQNSAEFASFIQSVYLKPNETLVSFDVVSFDVDNLLCKMGSWDPVQVRANTAVCLMSQQYIWEGYLPVGLHFHSKLDAVFNSIQVL